MTGLIEMEFNSNIKPCTSWYEVICMNCITGQLTEQELIILIIKVLCERSCLLMKFTKLLETELKLLTDAAYKLPA